MIHTNHFKIYLICLMSITCHVTTGTIVTNVFRKITDSFIPEFNIYSSAVSISRIGCIKRCQTDAECTSIRYLPSNKTCAFSNTTMVVSPASLAPSVQNWEVYMGEPYRHELVKVPVTWQDGEQFCVNKGGHLAVISTADENQAIAKGLQANGQHWDASSFGPWLGANDLNTPNTFIWVDGTPLTGAYENWMADNPDGYLTDENCVHMGGPPNVPKYQWNDHHCLNVLWCICEYD